MANNKATAADNIIDKKGNDSPRLGRRIRAEKERVQKIKDTRYARRLDSNEIPDYDSDKLSRIQNETKEALEQRFAEQARGEMRKPDKYSSRFNYDTYQYDYYCGSQAKIFFGDIWVDDIVTIQYNIRQTKEPIYSYASQNFDAVAQGTVLGEGMIAIAFKEVGYFNVIRAFIEEQKSGRELAVKNLRSRTFGDPNMLTTTDMANSVNVTGTSNPGLIRQSETIEEVLDNLKGADLKVERTGSRTETITLDDGTIKKVDVPINNVDFASTTGNKIKDFEDAAEVLEDLIWGDSNGKPFGVEQPHALLRADQFDTKYDNKGRNVGINSAIGNDYEDAFNILITFGDISDKRAEHTLTVLNDVHFTGQSVMVNPNGEPIAEVYNFFFRDINKSINTNNVKVNKLAFKLPKEEEFHISTLADMEKLLDPANFASLSIKYKAKYDGIKWLTIDATLTSEYIENGLGIEPFIMTHGKDYNTQMLTYIEDVTNTMFISNNFHIGDTLIDSTKVAIEVTFSNFTTTGDVDEQGYETLTGSSDLKPLNVLLERVGGSNFRVLLPSKNPSQIIDLIRREDFFRPNVDTKDQFEFNYNMSSNWQYRTAVEKLDDQIIDQNYNELVLEEARLIDALNEVERTGTPKYAQDIIEGVELQKSINERLYGENSTFKDIDGNKLYEPVDYNIADVNNFEDTDYFQQFGTNLKTGKYSDNLESFDKLLDEFAEADKETAIKRAELLELEKKAEETFEMHKDLFKDKGYVDYDIGETTDPIEDQDKALADRLAAKANQIAARQNDLILDNTEQQLRDEIIALGGDPDADLRLNELNSEISKLEEEALKLQANDNGLVNLIDKDVFGVKDKGEYIDVSKLSDKFTNTSIALTEAQKVADYIVSDEGQIQAAILRNYAATGNEDYIYTKLSDDQLAKYADVSDQNVEWLLSSDVLSDSEREILKAVKIQRDIIKEKEKQQVIQAQNNIKSDELASEEARLIEALNNPAIAETKDNVNPTINPDTVEVEITQDNTKEQQKKKDEIISSPNPETDVQISSDELGVNIPEDKQNKKTDVVIPERELSDEEFGFEVPDTEYEGMTEQPIIDNKKTNTVNPEPELSDEEFGFEVPQDEDNDESITEQPIINNKKTDNVNPEFEQPDLTDEGITSESIIDNVNPEPELSDEEFGFEVPENEQTKFVDFTNDISDFDPDSPEYFEDIVTKTARDIYFQNITVDADVQNYDVFETIDKIAFDNNYPTAAVLRVLAPIYTAQDFAGQFDEFGNIRIPKSRFSCPVNSPCGRTVNQWLSYVNPTIPYSATGNTDAFYGLAYNKEQGAKIIWKAERIAPADNFDAANNAVSSFIEGYNKGIFQFGDKVSLDQGGIKYATHLDPRKELPVEANLLNEHEGVVVGSIYDEKLDKLIPLIGHSGAGTKDFWIQRVDNLQFNTGKQYIPLAVFRATGYIDPTALVKSQLKKVDDTK